MKRNKTLNSEVSYSSEKSKTSIDNETGWINTDLAHLKYFLKPKKGRLLVS